VRLYSCGALHSYSRKRIPPRPLITGRTMSDAGAFYENPRG
jgi:hypothetical protein